MTLKNKVGMKQLAQLVLVSSFAITGCATDGNGSKLEEGTPNKYQIWDAEKPDAEPADTGIKAGNLITSGIAGVYQKTLDLNAKYQNSSENSKTAKTMERVRLEQGEEVWKKEVAALQGVDKKEYDIYMKNNINLLEVAVGYSSEAAKLAGGIASFDYKKYISNPFAMASTVKALGFATEQINSTKTALGFMIETRNSYQAMLDETGR